MYSEERDASFPFVSSFARIIVEPMALVAVLPPCFKPVLGWGEVATSSEVSRGLVVPSITLAGDALDRPYSDRLGRIHVVSDLCHTRPESERDR